jgi:hypothetical protein
MAGEGKAMAGDELSQGDAGAFDGERPRRFPLDADRDRAQSLAGDRFPASLVDAVEVRRVLAGKIVELESFAALDTQAMGHAADCDALREEGRDFEIVVRILEGVIAQRDLPGDHLLRLAPLAHPCPGLEPSHFSVAPDGRSGCACGESASTIS